MDLCRQYLGVKRLEAQSTGCRGPLGAPAVSWPPPVSRVEGGVVLTAPNLPVPCGGTRLKPGVGAGMTLSLACHLYVSKHRWMVG